MPRLRPSQVSRLVDETPRKYEVVMHRTIQSGESFINDVIILAMSNLSDTPVLVSGVSVKAKETKTTCINLPAGTALDFAPVKADVDCSIAIIVQFIESGE